MIHGSGSHGQGSANENDAIRNNNYARELINFLALEDVGISPEDADLYQEFTRLELEMCRPFDELDRKLVIG
jgi:hypothetical protein